MKRIVIEKLSLNKFEMLFIVRLQTERDTDITLSPKQIVLYKLLELSLKPVISETKHILEKIYSNCPVPLVKLVTL